MFGPWLGSVRPSTSPGRLSAPRRGRYRRRHSASETALLSPRTIYRCVLLYIPAGGDFLLFSQIKYLDRQAKRCQPLDCIEIGSKMREVALNWTTMRSRHARACRGHFTYPSPQTCNEHRGGRDIPDASIAEWWSKLVQSMNPAEVCRRKRPRWRSMFRRGRSDSRCRLS
jgi:hypothetical protein